MRDRAGAAVSPPAVLGVSALAGLASFAVAWGLARLTLTEEECQAELDARVADRLREGP